jgi:hypothetical protein
MLLRPQNALEVDKRGFDATSAETLIEGAELFAELSPDDQAFHQAHLTSGQPWPGSAPRRSPA